MSRSGKKAGRMLSRHRVTKNDDLCDVILDNFANSSALHASGRMKKNSIQVIQVVKKVKQLSLADDQTWEEKLHSMEVSLKDENPDNSTTRKGSSRRRKRTITSETINDKTGNDYPIDIWFLISEYISPEDVGKFAAICKTSLAVVSTAKFWSNLYKRFYRSVSHLPVQLQPECIVRRYGLRAHVIRALYFMYPPFVEKLKPQQSFDGDPRPLTKRLCVLAWSQKIKNHWHFSFKLKKVEPSRYGTVDDLKAKPNLLEMLEDITANGDDNCKVLQVTCLNYINLPMLSGQILRSVSLNVTRGMDHRLQLNFGNGPFPSDGSSPVVLDPVVNVRVLDWWHPSFPHSDGLNTSLFATQSDSRQFEEIDF